MKNDKMRKSVCFVLFSFLLLANRCAPEEGVPVLEEVAFTVKNNSSNAILVLFKEEIKGYKNGAMSPEEVSERFVAASSTKSIIFTATELSSSLKENNYVLAIIEGKLSKDNSKANLHVFVINKEELLGNSTENYLIYNGNQHVQVILEKSKEI